MRVAKRNVKWAAAAAIISMISVLLPLAQRGYQRATWRSAEKKRLEGLAAGQGTAHFLEVLGAPTFERAHTTLGVRELTFKRGGGWVQVLDREGVAIQYAVTVCDSALTIRLRAGGFSAATGEAPPELDPSDTFGVNVPAATAPAYWYVVSYRGNPSSYRGLAWGENDVCENLSMLDAIREGQRIDRTDDIAKFTNGAYLRLGWRSARINTVATSAPQERVLISTDDRLYLGPDRIQVRA